MDFKRLAPLLLVLLAGCGVGKAPITPYVKAQHLKFAPAVAPRDRTWILAAIDQARPEARQLIDDVDGMVTVNTILAPGAPYVGLAQQTGEDRYAITLNLAYLDGERKLDRNVATLHELGHVVDFALVPDDLVEKMSAELPTTGACFTAESGDCTAPAERFADTFAKWSLRGAVSAVGAGYSLASPASLEDWGAPLAALAIKIDVELSA